MSGRHRPAPLSVVALVLLVAACGRLADDTYHPFNAAQVREGFSATTTSTTRPPEIVTTTTLPPTTTSTVPSESIVFYFVTADGKLRAVRRSKPAQPAMTPEATLEELTAGPVTAEGPGLRTIATKSVVVGWVKGAVPPTIDLNPLVLALPPAEQVLLAGQIAATLTLRPGVGQVVLRVNGERWPEGPPLPAGVVLDPPRDVTGSDYSSLFAK